MSHNHICAQNYCKLTLFILYINGNNKYPQMIHRKFLGMSFHDKRFSFTRKTCLAAAKTIINEVKEVPEESPILWTMQAFSVAAAVRKTPSDLETYDLTSYRSFCA